MAWQGAQGSLTVFDTVVIASGASLSGAIDLGRQSLLAVIMPAGWDAASLTFQGSVDGTNFFNLYDANAEVAAAAAAAGRYVALDPLTFLGLRHLKIRSGTSGTPVNQTANRTLTLVGRDLG